MPNLPLWCRAVKSCQLCLNQTSTLTEHLQASSTSLSRPTVSRMSACHESWIWYRACHWLWNMVECRHVSRYKAGCSWRIAVPEMCCCLISKSHLLSCFLNFLEELAPKPSSWEAQTLASLLLSTVPSLVCPHALFGGRGGVSQIAALVHVDANIDWMLVIK